jgi:hypothetical protein
MKNTTWLPDLVRPVFGDTAYWSGKVGFDFERETSQAEHICNMTSCCGFAKAEDGVLFSTPDADWLQQDKCSTERSIAMCTETGGQLCKDVFSGSIAKAALPDPPIDPYGPLPTVTIVLLFFFSILYAMNEQRRSTERASWAGAGGGEEVGRGASGVQRTDDEIRWTTLSFVDEELETAFLETNMLEGLLEARCLSIGIMASNIVRERNTGGLRAQASAKEE